ncbi:MAG: hypothetical protein LBB79_05290 [Prevotellaceae bacterium]|jgi:hypothetical protein|nr:hypothetical protein [Prevotellaceae bacterium]
MTPVTTGDASRTGRKPLKDAENHPHATKVISGGTDNTTLLPNFSGQPEETFDEDFRQGLTPKQFMREMEQRILKW